MNRLEDIERDVEQKQKEIERQSEEVENNVEQLDHKIGEIQSALSAMSDDQAVRDSVSRNLSEREREKEQELARAQQLQQELEAVTAQVADFESINANSKSEVTELQGIGEDVGDAMRIIEERNRWVNERKSSIDALRRKLAGLR